MTRSRSRSGFKSHIKYMLPSFQTHVLVKSIDFMSVMNFNVYDLSRKKEGHLSFLFTVQGLTLGWWPYTTQLVFIKIKDLIWGHCCCLCLLSAVFRSAVESLTKVGYRHSHSTQGLHMASYFTSQWAGRAWADTLHTPCSHSSLETPFWVWKWAESFSSHTL